MGARVPSRERAEVELIRMGYRKDAHGNLLHPSGAGFSRLDLLELAPSEILREGRKMLEEDDG